MTYDFLLPGMSMGGAERVSLRFAHLLKEAGHQVRFISMRGEYGEMSNWIGNDFELLSLNRSRSLSAVWSLRKFLLKHPGDVVFSSLESSAITGLLACRLTERSIIVRLPNMPTNQLRRGRQAMKIRIVKWFSRRLYRRAAALIAQTDAMRDEAIGYYGVSPDKVVTIYNPIDEQNVRKKAQEGTNPFHGDGVHFLTVGTVDYRKGTDVLLEAFTSVRKQLPHSTLTIVGRPNGAYGKRIMAEWGDKEGIDFAGFQENPYAYMAHCDVFVLPSRMEGFPNVLLEAMTLDKPVVATTCLPIIGQLVDDGVNGYCCEVDNAKQLARCMAEALQLKDIHNTYHLFDKEKMLKTFEMR